MKKQKIIEILITALISAGIAFLQTFLSKYTGDQALASNPALAGTIGTIIHTVRKFLA